MLPKSPPTYRQKVATLPKSTVGPALVYSVSDDSDDEGGVSAPVSPATGKTKAEVPSLEVTVFMIVSEFYDSSWDISGR